MFVEFKKKGEVQGPAVGSREHIVQWLETKSGEYFWDSATICACGQYKTAHGMWEWSNDRYREVYENFYGSLDSLNDLAHVMPHTFEALRDRCRQVWGI